MKLYNTQDYYLMELREIWAHNFLEECARLCEAKPYLSDTERERLASMIVTKAMYYDQKDELEQNLTTKTAWRSDLK